MGRLHNLGMPRDRQQRATLARCDSSRSKLVSTARKLIYEDNHGVDGTAVETLLKPDSWVPTSVSMTVPFFARFDQLFVRTRFLTVSVLLDSMCFLQWLLIYYMSSSLGSGACFYFIY
jgi:hypothetical protein